jgi:multidrug resistance efflux pump
MASPGTFVRRTAWQWVKILLALALIAYGLMLIVPRLNEVSSTDAIVTARAWTVRAPEGGTVSDVPRVTGLGAPVRKDQPAARIDVAGDPKTQRELEDDTIVLQTRIKALEDQYNANEAQRKTADTADKRAEFMIAQANIGATLLETRKRLELIRASADRSKGRQVTVTSPVEGCVWRVMALAGTQVAAHDPLFQVIDTASIYVDCSVHRYDIPYIQPGGKVKVKVLGSSQWLDGEVETVLSPTSYDEQADFAVFGPRAKGNEYRVLVRLPNASGAMSVQMLGIGVRATVVFGHRSGLLENLLSLSH